LGKRLVQDGFSVCGSVRKESDIAGLEAAGIQSFLIHFPLADLADHEGFFSSDYLFILMPFERNTPQPRMYLTYIQQISTFYRKMNPNGRLFLASSTSIYPNESNTFSESTAFIPIGNRAEILLEAELACSYSENNMILRLGGLNGPGRPSAETIASGLPHRHPDSIMNYIHQDDAVAAISYLMSKSDAKGIYNLVCPVHPKTTHFYGPLIGKSDTTYFNNQAPLQKKIVVPQRLLDSGFTFVHAASVFEFCHFL